MIPALTVHEERRSAVHEIEQPKDRGVNLAFLSTGELFGGVEQFIATFSRYLQSHTHIKPVVLLFNAKGLYEKLRAAGIETYVVSLSFRYDPRAVRLIAKFLKKR